MKKFIIAAVLMLSVSFAAMAQPRAIGVNIGGGIDFSYQHTLGAANMLDLNVNVPLFQGIGATCTYDWVNPFGTQIPWEEKGEWNWEMGVGAGAGYMWKAKHAYVGATGHIGVSYDFWFPMQLSLDWRPCIGPTISGNEVGYHYAGLYGITLGIRYLF